jgi:DNA-binding NarL/FixJ family response regulator
MPNPSTPLTRREITILRYVAQGCNAVAISRKIYVQPRTVQYFFANIRNKLGVHSMAEVMYIAGRDGLLGEYEIGDEV